MGLDCIISEGALVAGQVKERAADAVGRSPANQALSSWMWGLQPYGSKASTCH
uniref:Uncharacterized protein n=1 Tax=Physcomitrium patens TaxID=3218 RepID=A0A2K1K7G4_PHYPA|nr:hypothetical protein PHYPA_011617 [Physcomitrium patens]